MVLTLRHKSTQAQIEGLTPLLWMEENYVVSESVPIGRIYKITTGENAGQWAWYIDKRGVREEIPTHEIAASLEEAKVCLAASWEVTKLHAKIGQLVVERDFLAKAFDR